MMILMPTSLPDTATCLTCGYALRGLPENLCPECGRAFEPDDPRTFASGVKVPWWHGNTDPPLWYINGLVLGITLAFCFDASSPGFGDGPLAVLSLPLNCIALLFMAIAIGDYFLRLCARAVARNHISECKLGDRARRGAWFVIPVCLGLILSVAITAWPMHVRFAMSRSALEQAAKEYLDGTRTNTGAQWIGLYRIRRVYVNGYGGGDPNGVFFETGWTVGDTIGFLYSPDRPCSKTWWFDLRPPWFIYET